MPPSLIPRCSIQVPARRSRYRYARGGSAGRQDRQFRARTVRLCDQGLSGGVGATPPRLQDGTAILVRPLRPDDERLYAPFLAAVTDNDVRLRFLRR